MSDKKYYWLKLKRDFFKRHDMQIIEAMPNGKDYVLFYLKMLVESVDHDGALRFSDTIPYNEQMLATITNTNIDVVRSAMKIFAELQMVEVLDDQTVYMREVQKMVGCETSVAERVRKSRERKNQQALLCNADVTKCNIEKEIELEKESEIDGKAFAADAELETLAYGLSAVLDEAQAVGLPMSQRDMDKGNELVAEYGSEWVLEALKRTVNAPASARSWRYVAGILRNAKQEGGFDGRKAQSGTPDATMDELRGVLPK